MCPRCTRSKFLYPSLQITLSLISIYVKILDGDGLERTLDSDEDNALMRKFAAESIVLLKNDKKVLPLDAKGLKKVAIVGGNAKAAVLSGGGSAALKPSYFVSPYDGIIKALKEVNPDVEITYSEGARGTVIALIIR
jgi:beta-glucosidase